MASMCLISPSQIYDYTNIYLYLGRTSLHYATEVGYTDIVKILVDHGANVSTKDNDGKKDDNTNIYIHINT